MNFKAFAFLAAALSCAGGIKSTAAAPYNATLARDGAVLSLKAYGTLGPLVSFLGIPNFKVDISDTPYTLLKPYKVDTDFGFLAKRDDLCVVAFRGTDNILGPDWIGRVGNLDATWSGFRKNKGDEDIIIYTHSGFRGLYDRFRYQTDCTGVWPFQTCTKSRTPFVKDVIACLSANPGNRLLLTGHSRGAALAAMMAIHFAADETLDLDESGQRIYDLSRFRTPSSSSLLLYTYGEPRNLITQQADSLNHILAIQKFRFINGNDLVPSIPIPLAAFPYSHFGSSFRILAGDKKVSAVDVDFPTKASETLNILDHLPNLYIVDFF